MHFTSSKPPRSPEINFVMGRNYLTANSNTVLKYFVCVILDHLMRNKCTISAELLMQLPKYDIMT